MLSVTQFCVLFDVIPVFECSSNAASNLEEFWGELDNCYKEEIIQMLNLPRNADFVTVSKGAYQMWKELEYDYR